MNKFLKLCVYLVFCGVSLITYAQPTLVDYLEINTENEDGGDYSHHNAIPLGKDGLLVTFEQFIKFKKYTIFTKYDTTFKPLWRKHYPMKNGEELVRYFVDDDYIYLLINKQQYEYEVLKISLVSGDVRTVPYRKVMKANFDEIRAAGDIILLGGEADNNPVVVHINTQTNTQQLLPSLVHKNSYLADLQIDTTNELIWATLAGKYNNFKKVFFYAYSLDGRLKNHFDIPDNKDYNLLTFRVIPKSNIDLLVLGTYASSKSKRPQGVYSLRLKNGEKESFKFYDFSYFNNFFNNLSEEKREKMLKKVKELRKKGDHKRYAHEYFVSPLRFDEHNDRIYLALEGYNPYYRQNPNSVLSPAMVGNPYFYPSSRLFWNRYRFNDWQTARSRNVNTIVTYKYAQGLVCAFDGEGNMIWDNQLDFDEYELDEPAPFFAYAVRNDTVAMLRIEDEKIYFKQSYKSQEQKIISEQEQPKRDSLTKVTQRDDEILLHWYDDVFLLAGYQVLRKSNNFLQRKRVFYFSKLIYPFSAAQVNRQEEKTEAKAQKEE